MDLSATFSRRNIIGMAAASTIASLFDTVAESKPRTLDWSKVEATANGFVSSRMAPGLSLAASRNGEIVYSRGFGSANLETSTPMTPNSMLRIGSITKQFTAAAILLLAEQGKLSLDDKLARFLPDFPKASAITLRHLLTHTSGLANYTDQEFLRAARTDYTRDQIIKVLRSVEPLYLFEPGQDWAYSDGGYMLLGSIIEILTGTSYRDFVDLHVIARAGLKFTSVDDASEIVVNRANGYTSLATVPSGFTNASFISLTYAGGAGAIRSTAEDLCRWHGALLSGKVVSKESLAQMLTSYRTSFPEAAKGKRPSIAYGFGIGVEPDNGAASIWHNGMIQGFRSEHYSYPDEKLSVAILANCDDMGATFQKGFNAIRQDMVQVLRA